MQPRHARGHEITAAFETSARLLEQLAAAENGGCALQIMQTHLSHNVEWALTVRRQTTDCLAECAWCDVG